MTQRPPQEVLERAREETVQEYMNALNMMGVTDGEIDQQLRVMAENVIQRYEEKIHQENHD